MNYKVTVNCKYVVKLDYLCRTTIPSIAISSDPILVVGYTIPN